MSFLVVPSRLLCGAAASALSRSRHCLPRYRARHARSASRAGFGLAALLVGALAAAGCAAQARVDLPRKSGSLAAPAALTSPALTDRQRVIAAYSGYWQAYAAAMSSQNAARARAILAPYDQPSAISQAIRADQLVWAAHETAYGTAATHVLSVHVSGRSALVHDCLDLSHFGATDTRTWRVVPDSFGLPRLNFYVTLSLSRGRWLVSDMQPVVVPCKP
jgi:hypothetical protein